MGDSPEEFFQKSDRRIDFSSIFYFKAPKNEIKSCLVFKILQFCVNKFYGYALFKEIFRFFWPVSRGQKWELATKKLKILCEKNCFMTSNTN